MTINTGGVDDDKVVSAIAEALDDFYSSLLEKINGLDIKKVMSRKNPYLYRAKAMQSASDIVESVLSAYVSSSEETIFGNCFFEPLAIAASGGKKAIAEGIDVEIVDEAENIIHLIAVKSGTAVFNSDSKKRQLENFEKAYKLVQQAKARYDAVIGYSYGKKKKLKSGTVHRELAGKEFWKELTGDDDFYLKIIDYMGTLPEQYVEEYQVAYAKAENRLVAQFTKMFCDPDGSIDWKKLVAFNSGY